MSARGAVISGTPTARAPAPRPSRPCARRRRAGATRGCGSASLIVAVSVVAGARLLERRRRHRAGLGGGHRPRRRDTRARRRPGGAPGCGSPTRTRWRGYFTVDDELPADLELTRGVGAGELLPRAAVGSGRRRPARVQLPVAVDAEQVPRLGGAGSVVDVYLVAPRARTGAEAARAAGGPALDAVTVVDAPPLAESFAATGKRQLVLAVAEQDARRFFAAARLGREPGPDRRTPGLSRGRRPRRRLRRGVGARGAAAARRPPRDRGRSSAAWTSTTCWPRPAPGQADVAVLGLDAPGPRPGRHRPPAPPRVRPVAVVPRRRDPDAARLRAARIGVAALVAEDDARRAARRRDRGRRGRPAADRRPAGGDPRSRGRRPAAAARSRGGPGGRGLGPGRRARPDHRRRRRSPPSWPGAGCARCWSTPTRTAARVAQQLGDPGRGVRAAGRRPAGRRRASWPSGSPACSAASTPHLAWSPGCRAPTAGSRSGPARSSTCSRWPASTATSWSTPASASRRTRPRSSAPGPGRNQMTLGALEVADEVVVVGSADPVGLSRLARGAGRAARAAPAARRSGWW